MKSFNNLILLLLLILAGTGLSAQTVNIISDASWLAKDATTIQPTWVAPGFNDASWANSVVYDELHGNNGGACTMGPLGTSAIVMWTDTALTTGTLGVGNNKDSSVYFRKHFTLASTTLTSGSISIQVNDQFTLFINGTQLGGTLVSGLTTFTSGQIQPLLVCGDNVIAIEAKNTVNYCWWVYFNMSITASGCSSANTVNTCSSSNYIPKVTGTNTYGCSQLFDNGTWGNFGGSGTSYYALYNNGATSNPKFGFNVASQGGYGTVTIQGGQSTNYPTLGFALQNSNSNQPILGAIIDGVETSTTAGSESMDLSFYTKAGTTSTTTITEKVRITSAGNVGIGTASPTHLLQLSSDDAAKPGTNTWTIISDQRLKTNVNPFNDGLSLLRKVKPVKFHYNGIANMPTEKEYVGILAQDIQKIAPYMVGSSPYTDENGKTTSYLNYDGNAMTYILINSIKELDAKTEEIARLKTALDNTNATIAAQQNQINDLCSTGCAGFRGSSSNSQSNQLLQNVPNPFSQQTNIGYILNVGTAAYININALDGKLIKHTDLAVKGSGSMTLNANELSAGTYTYTLYVDSKVVDTKLMVITAQE